MRNILSSIAISLSLVFVGSTAMGAGFALYEFSARGNAMGGAVVANEAEAASLAVNPALITQIEGSQVQVGATFVAPKASTEVGPIVPLGMATAQKREFKDRIFVLPNFYGTYQASENVFLGLAGFSRFGLGGEYKGNPATWQGSISAYKFDVLSYSITPTIAAKVTDELSLSAGLEAMWLDFSETKNIAGTTVDISGDGISWGGNFSAFYKPLWAEKLGLGLSYRSKVRHVINGKQIAGGATTDVLGSVALPDSLTFGAAYQLTDKLLVEAGIVGTFWSSYDALRVENLTTPGLAVEYKNYKDVYRLNLGAEYALTDNWDVRAGYVFDKSPNNENFMDTLVPVGDRHLFNTGVGYETETWGIDLAYTYLLGKDMSGKGPLHVPAPIDATFTPAFNYSDADSHMFAFTFKYKFPQRFLRSAN